MTGKQQKKQLNTESVRFRVTCKNQKKSNQEFEFLCRNGLRTRTKGRLSRLTHEEIRMSFKIGQSQDSGWSTEGEGMTTRQDSGNNATVTWIM